MTWSAFETVMFSQGWAVDQVRPHRAWVMDQYWNINSDNGANADYRDDWPCGQPLTVVGDICTAEQGFDRLQALESHTQAWRSVMLKTYYLLGGRCQDDRRTQ